MYLGKEDDHFRIPSRLGPGGAGGQERTWLCPRGPRPGARPSLRPRASDASPGSRATRGKGSGPPAKIAAGSGKGKNGRLLHSLEPKGAHLAPALEGEGARNKSIKGNLPVGAAVGFAPRGEGVRGAPGGQEEKEASLGKGGSSGR